MCSSTCLVSWRVAFRKTQPCTNPRVHGPGHGGDEFIKFQDSQELSSQDLAGAFEQMRLKKRYNEVLFATDTCQAATLAKRITSSGVLSIGSSQRGENSWSHHNDDFLGCTVIDRFTYHTLELVESRGARVTLGELMRHLTFDRLHSTAKLDVRNYEGNRDALRVPLRDFMGSVLHVDTRSVGELHIAGEPRAPRTRAVPDALGAARLHGLYPTLDATF